MSNLYHYVMRWLIGTYKLIHVKLKLMKNKWLAIIGILSLFIFESCEVVTGIFKAGVWSGVLLVVGIIALIIYLIIRLNKRN